MASQSLQPHFLLIPLMCPGHLIPMVDMGRLLARNGVRITIVTTPLNAYKFKRIIDRDAESGIPIQVLQLRFPCAEAGLPGSCENIEDLPRQLSRNFMHAASMLQQPVEQFMEETQPRPSCIISDRHLPRTTSVAQKFRIPRLGFDGTSCFAAMCSHSMDTSKIHEKVCNDSEPFVVPGLPDRIEFTKAQLPTSFNPGSVVLKEKNEQMTAAEMTTLGLVVNSFEELEWGYVEEYRKRKGHKIWCIGPLSLCNKADLDKAQRGNRVACDETQYLRWLDSWPTNSVIYACLGTLNCLVATQLMELALGLEASNRPFIWVIREGYGSNEFEKWTSKEGFEERTKGRGLLIRGWAPQVLLLSHPAIGGFLTHCGWNSVIEGVCAGVPMITWPLSAEQFFNEKHVVQLLKIGERIGAEIAIKWGDEDKYGVMVKREEITKAINLVMCRGEEGEERRKKARELQEMAKRAVEEGGSSYLNIIKLIKDVQQVSSKDTET
ncbi:hypothetical protein SLA2020_261070 [Shorea laevis]